MPALRSLLPYLLLAWATLQAAGATDPARLAAARALFDARKFPEAEAAFKQLAAADANNAEVHSYLGEVAFGRREFEAATRHLEKAIALAPKNGTYHRRLGDAYGSSAQHAGVLSKWGLAKKCLAAYQRAAEVEPDNVVHHQSLFEYYRQAPGIAGGGFDKAAAEAAIILKLDPIRGHTAYATLYVGEKKFAQAIPHLTEVKKLDATRGRLAFASFYTEQKQYDKAFAEFEEVLQTNADDYSALYQVGRLAAVTGQHLERGLATLRRCLELPVPAAGTPGHAAAHWRIGNLLEKKGEHAGARVAYQASLKVDPNFTQATESLKKLK